ncbi:endonuclease domain-containing protein [Sphingomonas floccifaciens]|uniref:Endonuclease domain-containing protein n=1 Tax=Sphingomonas floccifaciens TaxID=1844115 RepID=A0ABW4NF63_9SPHN
MLKDEAPKPRKGGVAKARRLRRELTLPEILLWQALRRRPAGLKFRKQHPSGPFTVDFYCIDAKLVVEVDGEAHSRGNRPQYDEARDVWLAGFGLQTLRVPATDVLKDTDAVVRGIVSAARDRLPLHHPAAPGGPPPRDKLGEEW